MPEPEIHLWGSERPYPRAQTGNYLAGIEESHLIYGSWDEFIEDTAESYFGGSENLVYRWEWDKNGSEFTDTDELKLFVIQQYKAYNFSISIAVAETDEPKVDIWLTDQAKKMLATWEPILRRVIDQPS